jgi:hypothetical protein
MKKWLVGALVVGFVGVLIAGAVIRTMDKTEQSSSARGVDRDRVVDGPSGRGNGAGEPLDRLQENVRHEQSLGGQQGSGRQYVQNVNNLQGNGRRYGQSLDSSTGGSGTPGDSIGASQDQVDEWVTLGGVVADVQDEALIIELSDGGELIIEGRAWSFAQELGFDTQIGNPIILAGFYEGDDFEVGRIIDQSVGDEVVLREISGRPLWAGNGRRGAQG